MDYLIRERKQNSLLHIIIAAILAQLPIYNDKWVSFLTILFGAQLGYFLMFWVVRSVVLTVINRRKNF